MAGRVLGPDDAAVVPHDGPRAVARQARAVDLPAPAPPYRRASAPGRPRSARPGPPTPLPRHDRATLRPAAAPAPGGAAAAAGRRGTGGPAAGRPRGRSPPPGRPGCGRRGPRRGPSPGAGTPPATRPARGGRGRSCSAGRRPPRSPARRDRPSPAGRRARVGRHDLGGEGAAAPDARAAVAVESGPQAGGAVQCHRVHRPPRDGGTHASPGAPAADGADPLSVGDLFRNRRVPIPHLQSADDVPRPAVEPGATKRECP